MRVVRGGWVGRRLNDFKIGAVTGRFQSDGAASMAVKGLSQGLTYGEPVWPSGKQKDFGSIPLRLSFLLKNCGSVDTVLCV